jgi:hypothetical protein
MNHNHWKSQYAYSFLNYQKIGFTPVSDYALLKNAAGFYRVTKKPQSEQFPIMNFSIPLQEPFNLHGPTQISEFLNELELIRFEVEEDSARLPGVVSFIDESIAANLDALFWHPTLTFNNTFHTSLSSYKHVMTSDVRTLLLKNLTALLLNIPRNLLKILRNR